MGDFFMEGQDLMARLGGPGAPRVFDVRRRKAVEADPELLPAAVWRDHRKVDTWAGELSGATPVVVYCVRGKQVSQSVAAVLRSRGVRARVLRGGIEAWRAAGGATVPTSALAAAEANGASCWVLPLDASLAVLGQAWVVRRFLDPRARFVFVAADQVAAAAVELDAVPMTNLDGAIDCPPLTAVLARLAGDGDALDRFARIIGADGNTAAPGETAGCHALFEGYRAFDESTEASLDRSLELCDALYAWLRRQTSTTGHGGAGND